MTDKFDNIPVKDETEKYKRVLIPRKDRKNPCVAEYKFLKKDKFDNVPVEDDTKIIFSTPAKFGAFDTLYQKCFWDGITAESLIFVTEDIKNTTMDELMDQVRNSPMVNDSSKEITTSTGKSDFTFMNFNFVMDDD